MSELEIRTRDDKTDFLPGEELAGEVSWLAGSPPGSVELRLFWRTEGKGTRDVEVVGSMNFSVPGRQDRREFRFKLPDSPYSFSGKLISVVWALELELSQTKEVERLDFVVSPTRTEIVLPHGKETTAWQ